MTKEELLAKALCCNRCGTCRGVVQDAVPSADFSTQCPSGMTLFGEYEPAGLMYLARGIAQGDLQWDTDLAEVLPAPSAVTAKTCAAAATGIRLRFQYLKSCAESYQTGLNQRACRTLLTQRWFLQSINFQCLKSME